MSFGESTAGLVQKSEPSLAIEGQIRQFVARNLLFNERGYPHSDETSFLATGVIDSLGVLELVTYVHEEFGVQVEPSEVTPENFDSVTRLAVYIRRKQGASREDRCVGA